MTVEAELTVVVEFASCGCWPFSPLWSFLSAVHPLSVSLHVHVKVEHQQLGLLCAVAAAHRAHQLGVGGPDAPHHAPAASALQRHQVADELARLQVPQFDRAVVRAGDDEVLVELEARHGALVLVGTWKDEESRSLEGGNVRTQPAAFWSTAGK